MSLKPASFHLMPGLTLERDDLTAQLEQAKAHAADIQQQLKEASSKAADMQQQLAASHVEKAEQAKEAEEGQGRLQSEIEELKATQVWHS